jgi:cytochrome c-type biogenesis protein CcmH/NrfG
MRTSLAAVLFAVAVPTSFAQDDDVKKALKLSEEAATAFQAGKNKEAIDLATQAVKLDPKNFAAHFVLGSAYLKQRQNAEAVKAFTEVIALYPKAAGADDRRGDA